MKNTHCMVPGCLPPYCCVTSGKLVAPLVFSVPGVRKRMELENPRSLQAVTGSTHLLSPEIIQALPYGEWE